MFIEFLIEAEDAVGDSKFQKCDEFFCRDCADIGDIGAVKNSKMITSCSTGTGMLVKRAMTSKEIKASSSGFIEICLILLKKSVLSLTKDEVLPKYFLRI